MPERMQAGIFRLTLGGDDTGADLCRLPSSAIDHSPPPRRRRSYSERRAHRRRGGEPPLLQGAGHRLPNGTTRSRRPTWARLLVIAIGALPDMDLVGLKSTSAHRRPRISEARRAAVVAQSILELADVSSRELGELAQSDVRVEVIFQMLAILVDRRALEAIRLRAASQCSPAAATVEELLAAT